jgi:hypothetical protein
MKRHVQVEGVRKWAGDHLLELQGEPLKVLDRFFGQYGPYVMQGCAVTPAADGDDLYDVAPGLVVLAGKDRSGADAVMVVPFAGVTGIPLPLYLTLAWEVRRREYVIGGVKPIAYDYFATASTVQPEAGTPHLILNATTPRFVDVIQDAKHSFVTEAERTKWNNLLPTLVEYVNELFATFDPTAVGELRQFAVDQPFDNPDYLPCDGSTVDWEDYPDLGLPVNGLSENIAAATFFGLGGNGNMWVAVKNIGPSSVDGAQIVTSPDLINWTVRLSLSNTNAQAAIVRFIDGTWVVGIPGANATLCYSTDGITWTSKVVAQYDGYFIEVRGIEKVGDTWITSLTDSVKGLLKSSDLITWTQVKPFGGVMASGNGRLIVIASDKSAIPTATSIDYTDNLVDWYNISLSSLLLAGEYLHNIACSPSRWIITTSKGNLLISTDNGNTWVKRPSLLNGGFQISHKGHTWIIGGYSTKKIAMSIDDGDNWEIIPSVDLPINSKIFEVENDDTFLITVENGGPTALRLRVRRVLPNTDVDANKKTFIRTQK